MDPISVASAIAAVAGIGVLLYDPISAIWRRLRQVRVPRGPHRYPSPPDVHVYPGVDIAVVAHAVNIWEALGHPMGEVRAIEGDPLDTAWAFADGIHVYPDDGTLSFLEAADGQTRAGATRLIDSFDRSDIILSRSGPATIEAVLRELAFAHDYDHPRSAPFGHLLHSDAARRGMDTRGLRASE